MSPFFVSAYFYTVIPICFYHLVPVMGSLMVKSCGVV